MVLIETIVVGEAKSYAHLTLPQLWNFAHRINADFQVRSNFIPKSGTPPMKADCPQWEKVNIIRDFAKQERHSTLIYLDADILPHPNAAGRVIDLLDELDAGAMGAVIERPESEPEKWAAFYRKWYQDFHNTDEIPAPYFNSGVMFITLEYAKQWAEQMPDKYLSWFWEQHYLNATAPSGVQPISVDFNWSLQKQPIDSVVFGHAYNTSKINALTRLALEWADSTI